MAAVPTPVSAGELEVSALPVPLVDLGPGQTLEERVREIAGRVTEIARTALTQQSSTEKKR